MKDLTSDRLFEQPVMMTIDSFQSINGQSKSIRIESQGRYFEGVQVRGLEYDEYDDAGHTGTITLMVSGNTIAMLCSGSKNIHMSFEKNRTCTNYYRSPTGNVLAMQVHPHCVNVELDRSGGHLLLAYHLDYDGIYASTNRVDVTFHPNCNG